MKRFVAFLIALAVASNAWAQVPYFPQTLPGHTVVGRSSASAGPTEAITFSQLAGVILPNPYTGSVATSLTITSADGGVGRALNDAVSFYYTGGTAGTVVTNQYASTTASAANTNYVWGVLSIMNNNAAAGQNVAGYWQGLKNAVGPTWAGVMEVRDTTHTANPTQALQGLEIDIVANGTDTGLKRTGLVIAAARDSAAAADATISHGLSFAVFAADIGYLTVSNGIMFTSGLYTKGINFNGGATYTSAAIHLPSDNGILMDTGGNASWAYSSTLSSSLLTENTSAGNAIDNVLTIGHTANGTFAAGMGVGISYRVMTAAATNRLAGYTQVVSSNVGSGTETFDYVVQLMNAGSAAAETGRVLSTGGFRAPAAGIYEFSGRSRLTSASDGVLAMTNAAATDFSRLNLGGATASFPAIKRSSAALAFRLADDSADAAITTAAITASGAITMGVSNVFSWNGRSALSSASDGVVAITNNAGTDFTRLQLGGTTASFPAIKRSSATLAFRLADDSADAAITAAAITASGNITAPAAGTFVFSGRSSLSSASDGVLALTNNAATAFTRLQFGGTSSSFPAIKRNSAALNFRLADDSADAAITSAAITASDTVTGTTFVPTSSSAPTNGMYLSAANTVAFSTNSGLRFKINATGLNVWTPSADATQATPTTYAWQLNNSAASAVMTQGYDGTQFVTQTWNSTAWHINPQGNDVRIATMLHFSAANSTVNLVTGSLGRGAPVVKTADWTQGVSENHIISNRAATNTVTLPSAATYVGREIFIRTITNFTVVSASSNVAACTGGGAGTAILAATAGKWALLVSDGTNWQIQACN